MRAFAAIMDLLPLPRPHLWLPNRQLFTGRVLNPTPNPQPGGGGPIFITPGTGWPSYTPRHWVSILVAFTTCMGIVGLLFNSGHLTGYNKTLALVNR